MVFRGLRGTPQHYDNDGFKGVINWPPLDRETPVSQTADVISSSNLVNVNVVGNKKKNMEAREEAEGKSGRVHRGR